MVDTGCWHEETWIVRSLSAQRWQVEGVHDDDDQRVDAYPSEDRPLELAKQLGNVRKVCQMLGYNRDRFHRFRELDEKGGRLCISNSAAGRGLRGVEVGGHNSTVADSGAGAERAVAVYGLIETAKFNDADARVWLAIMLARLPDHSAKRIYELLPWNWRDAQSIRAVAACRPLQVRRSPEAHSRAEKGLVGSPKG